MFRRMKDMKREISFWVNGKQITANGDYPPTASLLDFLRESGLSTGTKGCCYEGGCGICIATVTFLDPVTNTNRAYSVNSCCLALYSCDGLEITTVEGLGSTRSGVHPIQERLAKFDGAQCGYCSPGQVMNMYGLLKNKPKPTMQEVEDAFDATICRCTGYRSILDAMKSFAVDGPSAASGGAVDIEDLDRKICGRNGADCHSPSKCKTQLQILHNGVQWIKPVSLAELCGLLKDYAKENYRLVFGNTGFGQFKELKMENFKTLIDVREVKEFYNVDLEKQDHIILGANLTLTNLKELFESIDDPSLPYTKDFARHLQYVTSTSVRNLGCWAGNLMLKHSHPEFPSDVFTILETVGASINIANDKGKIKSYSLLDFLSLGMCGRVIVSTHLPKYNTQNITVRTLKTSPRLQLSIAHIASGFNFQTDATKDHLVEKKPTIIIQGISTSLIHASKTEEFLTNKKLSDPDVVINAVKTLSAELQESAQSSTAASTAYLVSLALSHFYKFILGVCKDVCHERFVSGGLDFERPVSSATHDYGTVDESVFPATKPMRKITAPNLTTGEVKFVNDLPAVQGQTYAAVLLSTQGNAQICSLDPASALEVPGVLAFVQASDIPGQNNWRPSSLYGTSTSELMSSGPVGYAGQVIGVIVAECERVAQEAVKLVSVSYTNVQPVIVDVLDAIQQKSFYEKLGPFTKGDAEAALNSAPHRVKGNTRTREQYHFHLENQAAICTPTDLGGMDVVATSQWLDVTQEAVAQVLGIPAASVTVEMQRLGGGFGSKILYNLPVAALTAVAAHKVGRPVKLHMDLQTNMQFQGCRQGYYYEYEIGFDNDGKLLAIVATGYSDTGAEFHAECNEHTFDYVDSTYFCPTWSWSVQPCKTHRPTITYMRGPGSATTIFAMECMIDHVATYLKKDHLEVRKINLYQNGQTTLSGVVLEHVLAKQVVDQLEADINYAARKQQVEEFNKANRWRKRGLHVMPSRYAMMYTKIKHNTTVTIYRSDASVVIAHGGVDMGQGINTKAIQVCAYKLGIPVDKIRVAKTSSLINANSSFTGGSTTSEIICLAVISCCDVLNERMAKSKASLENPTWEQVVAKSFADDVNMTCQIWPEKVVDFYSCYTACCSEVELDVLTGQYQILQVDYVYDCGISLNPELDLGQLEGAFVMGLGMFLLESMTLDTQTGKLLTDGSNTYKTPLTKDVPLKFNVKFLRNAPNPVGVLGSKAVGETPVAVGSCPMLALKRAIESAREDTGTEGWFPFHAPATVERIQQSCLTDITDYTLGK
ncbi:hypothetical protein BsWGS_07952 [Bradybaena similaris]